MHAATAEETGMPFACSIVRAQTLNLAEPTSQPVERYYISSLSPQEHSAQRYAQLVRGHWNIENGSHWQRDVLWREDAHQMRSHKRAHVLSSLRQVALHIHSMTKLRSPTPTTISHLARQAGFAIDKTIRGICQPSRKSG